MFNQMGIAGSRWLARHVQVCAMGLVLLWACLLALPAQAQLRSFTLQAPQAKQVFLAGEMTDWDKSKLPMQQAADGSWHATVDLGAGEWLYKFIVDGKWQYDQTAMHDADGFGDQHSFVFVGDGPWQEQPGVAHGTVQTLMVPSAAWGRPMKVNVYLPPAYVAGKAYPVLLLLHGKGMDADQWLKTGLINRYLDNLLAQGKLQPFVVVMPSSEQVFYVDQSEKFITQELPVWLKSQYGLSPGPGAFAVAGMSMGGFGAFYLPFSHPQQFGFGFALSAYFPDAFMETLHQSQSLPFKAMLLSGSDDGVTPTDRAVVHVLQQQGSPFYYREDPGAHTWNYWSLHTAEMLQAVSTYFSNGTALSNADSVQLPAVVEDAPLPIVGEEIAFSDQTVPKARVLGLWRGEWRLEDGTVKGRFEQTITAYDNGQVEGRQSTYDTGGPDQVDVPYHTSVRVANGRVYSTNAATGQTSEVIFSSSKQQLWRQWRVKVNGSNILLKVRKVEAEAAP